MAKAAPTPGCKPVTGECLCGAVRYEAAVAPADAARETIEIYFFPAYAQAAPSLNTGTSNSAR